MSVNNNNLDKVLRSALKLTTNESKTFIYIVKSGKMTPSRICNALQITTNEAQEAADSLLKKGMIIKISPDEYEALHPKFATSNRYKIFCEEENIEFRRNSVVDNLAVMLEGYYENARTK